MSKPTTEEIKKFYKPPHQVVQKAYIKSEKEYQQLYDQSIKKNEEFWETIAKQDFFWKSTDWKVLDYNFNIKKGKVFVEYFKGGKTNICYNAIDRHLEKYGDKIAYYWQGNEENEKQKITYKELHERVCKFANMLKSLGVKKGDRVAIYMPLVIELAVAILACARIGAIHSVVFGGYSSGSLAQRLMDCKAKILISGDGNMRGSKVIHLKDAADEALEICAKSNFKVEKHVIFKRLGDKIKINWNEEVDVWLDDLLKDQSPKCDVEWMDAEDPLFLLYTSGSTGGLVHTVGGYMVYTATTFKYVFDYHPDDVYFCTADIGWITGTGYLDIKANNIGHSYVVYGPLCNAATIVIYDGLPTYPDASRYWKIVDEYKVNQFYTAPTALRALMGFGEQYVKKTSRKTLRILGTVGEPINPHVWVWYYKVIGEERCAVVDTYWQTETGGFMITPIPGAVDTLPGSATKPFFGVSPVILNESGKVLEGEVNAGYLCVDKPWPGVARTVYGDHKKYEMNYFTTFPGYYLSGDGCQRTKEGYYILTGRIDDVLNVSGHRLGTAEIESALVSHPTVAEAAVVPIPHDVKGQAIYAFVTLKNGIEYSTELKKTLIHHVRHVLGSIATIEVVHWSPNLPKTRSGKIMRRILRKIAEKDEEHLGDISTIQDTSVIQQLIEYRGK